MDWLIVSSFVSGVIFSIMIVFLALVLLKTTIVNEYTKIAYVELLLAVSLRVVFCFLLGTGVAQLIEGVVPSMVRKGEGTIIVVSSIASLIDMPNSAVYAASKSFATRYVSSLAREVGPAGVKVTAVCPGYVHTNLHRRAGLDHLEKRVPRWLWIDASTVVRAAVTGAQKGKSVVVPGLVYRVSLPFLNWSVAQKIWSRITRRGRSRKGPKA